MLRVYGVWGLGLRADGVSACRVKGSGIRA